jgi:predicted O-methyltransferase YrrM
MVGISYIGDISSKDAEVLSALAYSAKSILEFGVGASTQVMAYYKTGTMISLETDPAWIEKTKRNFTRLGISQDAVDFRPYAGFPVQPTDRFDLIFDDGVDGYRREFATKAWPLLSVGGLFCFHDTRRTQDVQNVCALLGAVSAEVEAVHFNQNHSNITTILKKKAEHYEDWNVIEHRESWQTGWGEPPEGK